MTSTMSKRDENLLPSSTVPNDLHIPGIRSAGGRLDIKSLDFARRARDSEERIPRGMSNDILSPSTWLHRRAEEYRRG